MQQGSCQPQCGKASGEVANCIGTAVATSRLIHHVHLLHHHLMGQVRVVLSYPGVMKRDVGKSVSEAIEALQSPDLRFAKVALSIKNHDIRIGKLVGIGELAWFDHEI